MDSTDQTLPIPQSQRNLGGGDLFLLWAGAAISLAEIWAGGMLASLGFAAGMAAIVLGHVLGNTPLALGSLMGAREGLPSMVATRPALGVRGSYLASALNVVQLIGWTAVMLWLAGHAAASLARPAGEHSAALWTVLVGAATTLWAWMGARHWRWLHRVSITALVLLCAHMSWLVIARVGHGPAPAIQAGGMGWGVGLDLVIAMPISWLPLAADYARFGRSGRGASWGTWWGYLIVSSWMYALGLGASLATGSTTPEAMIMALMAENGWLLAALAIVILSTVTTTFLDVYSTAVSSLNLPVHLRHGRAVLAAGGLGTLVALSFSADAYEPFLLLIGALFCPLFGVVLTDYFVVRRGRLASGWQEQGSAFGLHWPGLLAWAAGFGIYRMCVASQWWAGASLPSFLGAGLLYLILRWPWEGATGSTRCGI